MSVFSRIMNKECLVSDVLLGNLLNCRDFIAVVVGAAAAVVVVVV
jgi:hypothetical protein